MTTIALSIIPLHQRVADLNNLIIQGKVMDAFELFYSSDVTMQENEGPVTAGKDACRIREKSFVDGVMEFRHAEVKHVLVSDNISAVEWVFDFTHNEWGVRNYTQVAIQRWNEFGQIVNEKFYYNR